MNPSERIDRILEILDNPTQSTCEPMFRPHTALSYSPVIVAWRQLEDDAARLRDGDHA